MGEKGFSIVEIVIVIAIGVILTSIAAMNFSDSRRKSSMEGQMRMIYSDMLELRQKALYEKVPRAVKLTTSHFYTYPGDDTTVAPATDRELIHPVALSGGGSDQVLVFDTYGISSVESFSVCIDPASNPAYMDSVIVKRTTIRTGKQGGGCAENTITLR